MNGDNRNHWHWLKDAVLKLWSLINLNVPSARPNVQDKSPHTMIQINPSELIERDDKGRCMLHFACKFGAPPHVIQILIDTNRYSVLVRDNLGRLPIHMACKCYLKAQRDLGVAEEKAIAYLLEVLNMLLKACRPLIIVEDNKDRCPLKYALNSDLPQDIIDFLQKVSPDERLKWKKKLTRGTVDLGCIRCY